MFCIEDDARDPLKELQKLYKDNFKTDLPMMLVFGDVITFDDVMRVKKTVDKMVLNGKGINIPKGYNERLY